MRNMGKVIRIGSRDSKLAVWQAEYVKHMIEQAHPEIQVEIITMKTTGDKILDRSLDKVGGKGLFVKELDLALLEKRTDLSVHSLKDMPMEVPEDLPILAYTKREDPRDAMIFGKGCAEGVPKTIGSSSPRRRVQLEKLFPESEFTGIRGNVQTRIKKLNEGLCDATVLAMAGLKRLDMTGVVGRIFETEEMIPAAGQGILGVQGRKGEEYDYLNCLRDSDSEAAALAERGFVKALEGGCSSPIAAFAKVSEGKLFLRGLYYNEAAGDYITGEKGGDVSEAERLGILLAEELKEQFRLRKK